MNYILFFLCFPFALLISDELFHLPQADIQGIVLRSKVLKLKGPKYPFNASIIKNRVGSGYLLFFREDLQGETYDRPSGARIGVVRLNASFDQIGEAIFPSYPYFGHMVEDPRVFWVQNKMFLLYYIYPRPAPVCPCLVQIDPVTFQPIEIHKFSQRTTPEKNWVPFLSSQQSDNLVFLRILYPGDLVQFNLSTKAVQFSPTCATAQMEAPPSWKWGTLSGGTPAERIGDSFLSFFHSWFLAKNGKRIYVMGACTFEPSYPFRMKAISPCPILFKDLYTARARNQIGDIFSRRWAQHIEKVIFPCGFVREKLASGQDVIHLSCGENDNSIRIITLDTQALFKNLCVPKKTTVIIK